MKRINLCIKRCIDVIGSGLGILLLSPLFCIIALLIKITMPGSVFFKQQRVGKGEKCFNILKFRSMKVDRAVEAAHDFSKDQERITPFGKFLRRSKIDELPQLINVLRGNMSFVGPRPTVKEQTDAYNDYQRQRLNMRPGITGLAQVNGNITLSWDERIEYDIQYINNFSILLDIKIILKTILVVLIGEDKFNKGKAEK